MRGADFTFTISARGEMGSSSGIVPTNLFNPVEVLNRRQQKKKSHRKRRGRRAAERQFAEIERNRILSDQAHSEAKDREMAEATLRRRRKNPGAELLTPTTTSEVLS